MPLMLLEAVNPTAIMTIESITIPTTIPTLRFRWLRKTEPVLMTVGVLVEEVNLLGWTFARCPFRFPFFTVAPQWGHFSVSNRLRYVCFESAT